MDDPMFPKDSDIAELANDGDAQVVVLPKGYRFPGDAVRIRGDGAALILEPINTPPEEWAWLEKLRAMGPPDDDFVEAALDRPKTYDRPDIEFPE